MSEKDWNTIESWYQYIIDIAEPGIVAWHLKPCCEMMLKIILQLRDDPFVSDFKFYTSHVTLVFEKPHTRKYIHIFWSVDNHTYIVQLKHKDKTLEEEKVIAELALPLLKNFLIRLSEDTFEE